MKKTDKENKVVSLPEDLYDKIEAKVQATEFHSVDEYVVFVLEEVLDEGEEEVSFSEKEEEEVKNRLRALGYLE